MKWRIVAGVTALACLVAAGTAMTIRGTTVGTHPAHAHQQAAVKKLPILDEAEETKQRSRVYATVTPNGIASTVSFSYGLTSSYGTTVSASPAVIAASDPATIVSADIVVPTRRIMHYRFTVTSAQGTVVGADHTIGIPSISETKSPSSTPSSAPGSSAPGSSVPGSASAQFSARITSDSVLTGYELDWSTSPDMQSATVIGGGELLPGSSSAVTVTIALNNVSASVIYYRFSAMNVFGSTDTPVHEYVIGSGGDNGSVNGRNGDDDGNGGTSGSPAAGLI